MFKNIILIFFFFLLMTPLSILAEEENTSQIPEKFKIVIKGTLLDSNNSPKKDAAINLYPVVLIDGKIGGLTIFDDSQYRPINPSTSTNNIGSFVIVVDRRFLEKKILDSTRKFSLGNLSWGGEGLIKNIGGNCIVIELDEDVNEIALGEIVMDKKCVGQRREP